MGNLYKIYKKLDIDKTVVFSIQSINHIAFAKNNYDRLYNYIQQELCKMQSQVSQQYKTCVIVKDIHAILGATNNSIWERGRNVENENGNADEVTKYMQHNLEQLSDEIWSKRG